MKNIFSFEKFVKERKHRRILALALAFLLAFNVLVVALPRINVEKASADSVTHAEIINMNVAKSSVLDMKFGVPAEPVIPTASDADIAERIFRVFVDNTEVYVNDTYYPAEYSYTDGLLSFKLQCDEPCSVRVYANTDDTITSFTLNNESTMSNRGLESLKLMNMPSVATVDVSGTPSLESLGIGTLTSLKILDASDCSLESIQLMEDSDKNISIASGLESFDCSNNNLTFTALNVPSSQPGNYTYGPQNVIKIPAYVSAGGTIDISSSGATDYHWFDNAGNEITEGITMGNLGIFTFDDSLAGKSLYCTATHALFDGLTLETTYTNVVDNMQFYCSPNFGPAEIIFTSLDTNAVIYADGKEVTSTDMLSVSALGGDPAKYAYTLTVTDSDISDIVVVSEASVTDITISSDNLSSVGLDNCKTLESLSIDRLSDEPDAILYLDDIDLGNNVSLTDLTIKHTELSGIDLTNNTALERVNLESNKLSSVKLPQDNAIKSLNVNDNSIASLDLSSCKELERLKAEFNKLTSADLTANEKLTSVYLCGNDLETVNLYDNGTFTAVDLSNNKLNHGTLPAEPLTQNPVCTSYAYGGQDRISIDKTYTVGEEIDLTDYASAVPGDKTTYTLYVNDAETLSNSDGKFTVTQDMADQNIYFVITSEKLGDLELPTTQAYVYPDLTGPGASGFTVCTDQAGPFSFSVVADRPVYVSWGDGNTQRVEREDGDYSKPIEISGNVLPSTVPNQENIFSVSVNTSGKITEIDVSRDADNTPPFITGIYVARCPDLTVLDVSSIETADESERITILDLASNTDLEKLYAANNNLYNIDLSNNVKLKELDISNNNISQTDLTANTALEILDCSGNSLTSLELTEPGSFKTVKCENNALTFNTLPDNLSDSVTYTYSPQADIEIPTTMKAGTSIDLSSIGATSYKWINAKTKEEITPKTSNNGVFTFGDEHDGISAYCEMKDTDDFGNDFVIKTTNVNLTATLPEFGAPTAVLRTSMTAGQDVSLTISCDDTVYIDWGDGKIVSDKTGETVFYTAEDALGGTAIKLYTSGKLTLLSATDMKITEASLTSATDLETLNLSGNLLETIDLSKNTKLKKLDISDNCFTIKDLPYVAGITEANYTYSPQATYQLPSIKAVGGTVDLSELYRNTATGSASNFVWYKKGTTEDTVLSASTDYENLGGGKFKFKDPVLNQTVYCAVVNEKFPDFTTQNLGMKTTEMKITPGGEFTLNDAIGMIVDVVIEEGATCTSSDNVLIAAGDLTRAKTPSNNTLLTFNSKKFADTTSVTSATLLAKVKTKLSSFDASKNNYYIYDFSFLDSKNKEIRDFSGKVKITLKYPTTTVAEKYKNYTFYMFHYNDSGIKAGTMDEIAVSATSDGLTFDADSFSPYVLVYQNKSGTTNDDNNNGGGSGSGSGSGSGNGSSAPGTGETDGSEGPKTGDDSTGSVIATIVLCISAAVIIGGLIVIITKKKKGNK